MVAYTMVHHNLTSYLSSFHLIIFFIVSIVIIGSIKLKISVYVDGSGGSNGGFGFFVKETGESFYEKKSEITNNQAEYFFQNQTLLTKYTPSVKHQIFPAKFQKHQLTPSKCSQKGISIKLE